MHRVRTIFVFRSLLVPALIEVGALGALVGTVITSVSLTNVAVNFQQTVSQGSVLGYLFDAVMNTEATTQIFLSLGVGASAFFIFKVVRAVRLPADTVAARVQTV